MTKRGFTLLEILVALLVFAIGVTGMLSVLSRHLREISLSEDHARAVRIAQREMNALRRLRFLPDAESEGEEGRFVWITAVEEADPDELPGTDADDFASARALRPYHLNVTVRWRDAEGGDLSHRLVFQGLELFQQQ